MTNPNSGAKNRICLICRHVHFMMVSDDQQNGNFQYKYFQCSITICGCPKAILNNLDYLEVLYEQTQMM
jgi:hypothetical protein